MIASRKQGDKINKTQGYQTVDQTNKLSNSKDTYGYKALYFRGDNENTMYTKKHFFIIKLNFRYVNPMVYFQLLNKTEISTKNNPF